MSEPLLTIILPTYNEAANVRPLLATIHASLDPDIAYEVLFVDDSTDETPDIINAEMLKDHRVRLIRRAPSDRLGLATAYVEGFKEARGAYVCCMDADLQHPPEVIKTLLKKIITKNDDVVIASRYMQGGNADGLGSRYRKSISIASKYALHLFLEPTRRSSDPGSGFFIFRKSLLNTVDLSPRGFKILIELLVRTNTKRVSEVPVRFLKRENHESKATLKQGIEFLKHLWLLFRLPYVGRFIKFASVGTAGAIVNLGILYVAVAYFKADPYGAWLLAVLVSILSNFILNGIITYRDRPISGVVNYAALLGMYYGLSLGTMVINFVTYHGMLSLGVQYLIAGALGIIAAMFVNYVLASRVIWRPSKEHIREPFMRTVLRRRVRSVQPQ